MIRKLSWLVAIVLLALAVFVAAAVIAPLRKVAG